MKRSKVFDVLKFEQKTFSRLMKEGTKTFVYACGVNSKNLSRLTLIGCHSASGLLHHHTQSYNYKKQSSYINNLLLHPHHLIHHRFKIFQVSGHQNGNVGVALTDRLKDSNGVFGTNTGSRFVHHQQLGLFKQGLCQQ